jgi:hypothetical protein
MYHPEQQSTLESNLQYHDFSFWPLEPAGPDNTAEFGIFSRVKQGVKECEGLG